MTTLPILTLDKLTLGYDDQVILSNISFDLKPCEITTLIGPNGAGKTSLIKAILGLVAYQSGSIQKKTDLRIGYMPQKIQIEQTYPLTVKRFLNLWADEAQGVFEILKDVGAEACWEKSIHALSGGQLQRVMLARALLNAPELLILDEPAQGLDVQGQVELFHLIEKIAKTKNCAILLISHDLHLVMAKSDHVICINHHICCSGHPETVQQHPEYRALFGHHADALGIYHHVHDHNHD